MAVTAPDPIADLERRVAALEGSHAADTIQPNVLAVNPDGTIGANFTGHVAAQGVDLQSGTSATPPDTDRIRWVRTSDGARVADIKGYSVPMGGGSPTRGNNFTELAAYALNSDDQVSAGVTLYDAGGARTSGLTLQQTSVGLRAGAGGNPSFVQAVAGNTAVNVIQSDGGSSFLRNFTGNQVWIDAIQSIAKNVPAGSYGSVNFTTNRTSWTSAIVLAAFTNQPATPCQWAYQYGGGATWTINIANNSSVAYTYTMAVTVIGY